MSRSRSRSRDPSLHTPPSGLPSTARSALGNHTTDGRPSFELSKLEEEDKKTLEYNEAPQ